MNTKKILHVSYSMDTGGGPLTIKRIIEDFPEYDHHVAGNRGVYMNHFQKTMEPLKITFLKGPNLLYNLWILVVYCKKNDIDILHVHGRGAGTFARFVKMFIKRTKVVYTPNGFFPGSLRPGIRLLYILGERFLLSLTDIIFFVSESERNTFARSVKEDTQKKYIVIQNYINPAISAYHVTLPYSLTKDNINILFIGRFSAQKGVDILIDSVKRIENENFRVYIVGYGEMETLLKQAIKENLKLKDRIVVIGKVDQAFRLMPNFDALLLPSRFEGLPFTILEAMWYKLPLIVTPANGIIDILDQRTSYMAEEINSDKLAEALEKFMQDWHTHPLRIKEMIDHNHQLLLSKYSLEAVRSKIQFVYQ